MLRCDRETLGMFLEDRRAGRVGGTTAVFDRDNRGLYFSKEVIPYVDGKTFAKPEDIPVFHHVGVYAYRPAALRRKNVQVHTRQKVDRITQNAVHGSDGFRLSADATVI